MGDGASSSRSGRGGGTERVKGGGAIGESKVTDHGRRRSSCGYCRSTSYSSISHGLWADSITAEDYQELLDHGWRRSGCFLYKPEMEGTCCPSYTIRLKATDFYPSKEQARIYKKMQRFLDDTTSVKKFESSKQKENSCRGLLKLSGNDSITKMTALSTKESSASTCENMCNENDILHSLANIINSAVSTLFVSYTAHLPKAVVKKVTCQAKKKLVEISEDLVYTSSIAFQIAAAIRRSQSTDETIKCRESELLDLNATTIAEQLACLVKEHELPSELLIKACNGHLNFYSATKKRSSEFIDLKESMQASRGNRGNTKRICSADSNAILPQKRRKLEIRMNRSSFDQEEFALYRRYQIKVHDDKPEKVTVGSYKRFLVDTPIVFVPPVSGDNTIPPCGFGSFHQQYLIDGKLVAVGVVDVLPRCLSSKYLFWDPDFAFLSLGKYSALQEINWVKETQNHCPSLQYYYLGYYIHSCNKMRYKAAYRPSELLCPLRYQWVPFEVARPLLDRTPYVILSDSLDVKDCAMSPKLPNPVENLGPDFHDSSPMEDLSDEDEEEDEEVGFHYEDSDTGVEDESNLAATNALNVADSRAYDVGDIVLDVNGSCVKFKDIEKVFGPLERRIISKLESQLQRFVEVVGNELAGRMVYSLG
ncbi:unnamed protein product [Musa acuminata subsp. malaccensis]|uniref:arginyltransferase n=2 Tax=Musa acuminata subsp. malaccensis TaxID=214687 RepID=A0A804KFL1_MUSAM|nr:PREDICTED: arginyl-tRNA--protein transferase 2-like isoform X1 [Musa acuminata subsp. malaccensis]CAG1834102.1 unnamed protein product [Musa acuminata subsp. malaccensis]